MTSVDACQRRYVRPDEAQKFLVCLRPPQSDASLATRRTRLADMEEAGQDGQKSRHTDFGGIDAPSAVTRHASAKV